MSENLVIVTRPSETGPQVLTGEKLRGKFEGMTVFPGGKAERSESPDDAAIREVHEETGIRLDAVRRMGWLSVHDSRNPDMYRHVTIYGAAVAANTESTDTAELVNSWRSLDDVTLTDTMPPDVGVWWDIVRTRLPDAGWNQVAIDINHHQDGTMQVYARYPDFADQPNTFLRHVTFPPKS